MSTSSLSRGTLTSRKYTVTKNSKKLGTMRVNMLTSPNRMVTPSKSFVLYRMEILRLLNHPKTAHDALIIELPCLMGFRAKEVATWRAEYIHFDTGDTEVFDAKKHRLFTVPLHPLVARHSEEALDGRERGYVIQNESSAWRGREQSLTTTALWYVWRKYAELLNLYPSPEEYSPIVGRRFFAAEWHYGQRLPIETLSRIMRHGDSQVTYEYVDQLVFYEDLKRDFDVFSNCTMKELKETKQ